jgi:hypothetical protein
MPTLPKLETLHPGGENFPLNQTLNQALNQDTRANLALGREERKAFGIGFFIVLKKIFPPWAVIFEL